MANQIIIDIGAVANDGTGDPLRTAFGYVNDNFSNIWSTGVANSNVAFDGNKILTVNTNGNLVLAPNGTGKVVANVDIVPNMANVRNLGALTNRWSTVYSQYLNVSGEVDFTGDLTVGGNLTVTGNTIQIGNITTETKTIQLANSASTANAADGSGVTVGANDDIATMLYSSTSNTWVMNIGANITGNVTAPYFIGNGSQLTGITSYSNTNATSLLASFGSNTISTTGNITAGYFIGNGSQLTGVTSYANANAVAYGQAGWAGNIIPATSNTYSLGNSTNQWSDLYVSNATIYMNNVPISLTAGNVLTVNGEDVVVTNGNGQSNIGNLAINGTAIAIAGGATETDITISPNGESYSYLQIPNDATANVANARLHNDVGNIELGTGSGSYLWYFGNDGNLTIPNGGDINFVNTGGITQAVNNDLRFTVGDNEEDGWAIESRVNDGAGNDLTRMQVMYDGVAISTDIPTNNYRWDFRDTGEFDVPKSIRGPVGSNLVISIGDQFGAPPSFIDIQTRSHVGDALISNIRIGDPDVTISTSSGAQNWTFGGTGNLSLPPSGKLVGTTPNNNGYLNWFGNSSGDGLGYTTMNLVPDDTTGEAYVILDPTAPNHIHIRAGGTQDNSAAQLYLGGENSYFKVDNGSNPNVYVASNSNVWRFGTNGNLVVPNSIHGTNSGAPIVIDAGATGDSFISIPSYTDDGEQLRIKNSYASGNGIVLQTTGGTIHFTDGGTLSSTGAISATGSVTGSNFFGVAGDYVQPTLVTPNPSDANWAFGIDGDGTANFWMQSQFYGQNQATRGFRVLESEGNTVVFSVNGLGNAVVSGNVNAAGATVTGNITGGNLITTGNVVGNVSGYAIGYRDIPQVSFTGNATLAATDAGKHYYSTLSTGNTLTIPNNSSVSWPVGTAITVVNRGTGNITIAQDTGVNLYLAGNSTASNRTLTTYGMATLMNVAGNVWMINGTGVV